MNRAEQIMEEVEEGSLSSTEIQNRFEEMYDIYLDLVGDIQDLYHYLVVMEKRLQDKSLKDNVEYNSLKLEVVEKLFGKEKSWWKKALDFLFFWRD